MGFKFLISTTVKQTEEISQTKSESQIFKINTNKIKANLYINNQGFIVVKGSKAKKELSKSITSTYIKLRAKLIETKILEDKGEFFEFVEDTVFSSSSAASNMILGRNSNGLTSWVTEDGIPLKEIE